MLKRSFGSLYGLGCHAVFFGTHLYAIGFVAKLLVTRSVDAPRADDFVANLIVDLALLLGFALQHGVIARKGLRVWLTRFIAEPLERNAYLLASSRALIALFAFWRPLDGTVWSLDKPAVAAALHGLCNFGWVLMLASIFLISHFRLFGLGQVWVNPISTAYRPTDLRPPGAYRRVRRRLYIGGLFAFWSTPAMTAAHLLFAVLTTAYILIAVRLEARDLIASRASAWRCSREDDRAGIGDARAGRRCT